MNNWTAETIFNKERFEAWLANQPGERGFMYDSCTQCALCNFIRETTSAELHTLGPTAFSLNPDFCKDIRLPYWVVQAVDEAREIRGWESPLLTISHLRTAYQKLFGVDVCAEYPTESTTAETVAGKV